MAAPKKVALCLAIGTPFVERIVAGILAYAEKHGPWTLAFNPETAVVPIESLRNWKGHGVIGIFGTQAEIRTAMRLGLPVVTVSSAIARPRIPCVTFDNHAVGRLAAEHLLSLGLRRFAYYGLSDVAYGRARGEGFAREVKRAGGAFTACFARSSHRTRAPWHWDRSQLVAWLRRLEPPVGLFVVHDYRARLVAEECATLGLRIPEDVFLVGVNDDPLACTLAQPSLTSIALPGREVGTRAAALLARLMAGGAAPKEPVLIPPEGCVARQSTEALAVSDELVRRAVDWMNRHLTEPFNMVEIANAVGRSRRLVELRFHGALGLSPRVVANRLRLQRAQRLLADPARPLLKQVAARSGWKDVRAMDRAFETALGVSPQKWRAATLGS